MQKFIRKKLYKALPPEETISKIQSILEKNGLRVRENVSYHECAEVATVQVVLLNAKEKGLDISTNGKGMTIEYARASAYGEMMERLQNGMFQIEFPIAALNPPDIVNLSKKEMLSEAGNLFMETFNLSEEEYKDLEKELPEKEFMCVPFEDVFRKKTVLLPYIILIKITGSNGMSAGNTLHEALAQGIGEIYERQSFLEFYRDNPPAKSLPEEMFADTEVLAKLKLLEKSGYKYIIIDGSQGKDYPVIGLHLKDENGVQFSIGADPDPVVALERCLTEMFQMLNIESMKYKAHKEDCGLLSEKKDFLELYFYIRQFYRNLKLGCGKLPRNLFYPSGEESKFFTAKRDDYPGDDYEYLAELTKKQGHHLYIRDNSTLGFPACYSYIPEFSRTNVMSGNGYAALKDYLMGKSVIR